MRRADREVTGQENILKILNRCEILRIAFCCDCKPYIVPMHFACEVVDGTVFIYLHCAPEGKKLAVISKNDNVCFEADRLYRTVRAENACNWSAEFESVIGEGRIAVLSDEKHKIHALNTLMNRYGFEGRPDYNPRALTAVTVLRISVTAMTGKCSKKQTT